MKYENLSITVFVLQKAVEKLNLYGMDIFEMFCNENDISYCDRNRCIAKAKFAYGKTNLKEMPCPDNMKQERLRWYKTEYGYSEKKALELLKKIDASYEDQFIPRIDANKIASNMLKEIPKTGDREKRIAELREQASGMLRGS